MTHPLDELFRDREGATLEPVEDPQKDWVNRALVVQYGGHPFAVVYSANSWMRELLTGLGAGMETFDVAQMNLESELPPADGVYVCELKEVDDGPGDYPGTRETTVSLRRVRPATAEEWAAHCRGEWPWDITGKEQSA